MALPHAPVPHASLSRGAKALGLFLLAALIALGVLAAVVFSPPIAIQADEGQARIVFTADRRSVFLAGDCLTVRWQVTRIRAVAVNGQPTPGEGEQRVCVSPAPETLPTLQVVFQDNSVQKYVLPISIVSRSPLLWAALACALLLLGLAAGIAFAPRLAAVRLYLGRAIRLVERALLLVCVTGLLLELGTRWYFSNFGTEREKVMYLYSAAEINSRSSAQLIPMPYVSYVASPSYEGHNRLGYRGPEVAIPKPPGVFRIVALGGSTTYSTATTAEEAYPHQLQILLREGYGYANVEVVNAGLPGYTSWDLLAAYIYRVVELEPDMLLIYEGINDVEPRSVAPDCYRGLNPLRGLNPMRGLWQWPQVDSPSALYRLVAIRFGWMPDPAALTGRFNLYSTACARPFLDDSRIPLNPPVYFERNLREIIALARSQAVQVMLSTWATYRPDGDPGPLPPIWYEAVAEHNDILRQLADKFRLPLYDLAATDFGQIPDYWALPDTVHVAARGAREQAARYAAFIAQRGLIPPP